jgi:ribose 5-phosphate isomerase B
MREKDNIQSVAIGSDHGVYTQKEALKRCLETAEYRVVKVGCRATERVDYLDIATAVWRRVVSGDCKRGIILDGTGIGSGMAMYYNLKAVVKSYAHNNVNELALGGCCTTSHSLRIWQRRRCRRSLAWGGTRCQ